MSNTQPHTIEQIKQEVKNNKFLSNLYEDNKGKEFEPLIPEDSADLVGLFLAVSAGHDPEAVTVQFNQSAGNASDVLTKARKLIMLPDVRVEVFLTGNKLGISAQSMNHVLKNDSLS